MDKLLQFLQVHVALERQVDERVVAFGNSEIHRVGTQHKQIGLGGVEMAVIGDGLTSFNQGLKEHAFRGTALVSGQYVRETESITHSFLKAEVTAGAGVGFISAQHTRPLHVTHGTGATVREQVNEDIFRADVEEVVPRCF